MRRALLMLVVLALVAAGCGGDEESDNLNNGDNGNNDVDNELVGGDPDFSLNDLPDDFPDNLVPPSWDSGVFSDLTGFPSVSFESSMSFQDLIDYYNDIFGEAVVVGDDPGERLASWTQSRPWGASVFEGSPALVTIVKVEE